MSHFTKVGQKRYLSQSNEASNRCQGQILNFKISSTISRTRRSLGLLSILRILFKKFLIVTLLTFSIDKLCRIMKFFKNYCRFIISISSFQCSIVLLWLSFLVNLTFLHLVLLLIKTPTYCLVLVTKLYEV